MSVLNERQKTHGEYANVSRVAQHLKTYLGNESPKLDFIQQESLDLICTKLARIVCGDANELDHWVDISGYADLVVFNAKDKKTASRANVTIMEMDPDEESSPSDNVSFGFKWSR